MVPVPPNPVVRRSAIEFARRRQFGENNINAGRLREFPWISVDKFYGEHLQAKIFILTHCHTDHMVGLDEPEFWDRLQEPDVKLYVHSVTTLLLPLFEYYLRGKEGILWLIDQDKLIPLEVLKTTPIYEHVTKTELKLTLLPAGHCPGSVMLQFEYDNQCILYTGDCRIQPSDLKKRCESLYTTVRHNMGGAFENQLKPITHLYIDTTFCSSRSQDFPERPEAVRELVKIVDDWLRKDSHNCVNLNFAARFAHEYVFLKFYEVFKIQTHVNKDRFLAYQQIPSLRYAVTQNPNTRFHLCEKEADCLINFTSGTHGKILKIRLSSLWYMENKNGTRPKHAVKHDKGNDLVTMCYAMHSSLDEIGALVNYLKPNVVTPLVLPKGMCRTLLQSELRQSAKCDFIYEDYSMGLNSPIVLKVKEPQPETADTEPDICKAKKDPLSPKSAKRERQKKIRWRTPSPTDRKSLGKRCCN